jgi:hypothetical protein
VGDPLVSPRKSKILLDLLNAFAKQYVAQVKVIFRNNLLQEESGQSDLQKLVIFLAPRQRLNADAIHLGFAYAYRIGPKYRKMKLRQDEVYFLTLLHEIGHFKIKERVPKMYERLKRELVGKGISDHLIELTYIENKMRRRSGERESAWRLRLADFMSWLTLGETITHHMKVENWAINEFERKRKKITGILQDAGLSTRQELGIIGNFIPNSLTISPRLGIQADVRR